MVLADKMFAIPRKEFAIVKIQAQRQMPATVFVGDQFPLEPRKKSLRPSASTHHVKLHGLALRHFIHPRNFYPAHRPRL